MAHAKAAEKLILAEADVELRALQERAARRFVDEQVEQQRNMEDIVARALPGVTETARPEEIPRDWLVKFFAAARQTSESDMQSRWAALLAGEANEPGTFSLRCIAFVEHMRPKDGQLFEALLSYQCVINGALFPCVLDVRHAIYTDHGINFGRLHHMDTLGLVMFDSLAGYALTIASKFFSLAYFGETFELTLSENERNDVKLGHVLLTDLGAELTRLCTPKPNPSFSAYLRANRHLITGETPPAAAAGTGVQ
jgi:hypothetical protein